MKDSRAAVARFYDLDREPLADLSFYLSHLPSANARVLELGSGTGRITLPLARHCGFVHGIELSEAMLEICRRKLTEAPGLAGKVALELGDITSFDLGAAFDLIIAPYRVLQNLETDEEIAGLFRCVRTHLGTAGTCILNVFRPHYDNAEALIDAWSRQVEELHWEHVTDTRVVSCHHRKGKVKAQPLVIYPDLVYRVREGEEVVEEVVFPLVMRCYFPDEFACLFSKHGLDIVERWGGYAGETYGIGPELVIEARAAANKGADRPLTASFVRFRSGGSLSSAVERRLYAHLRASRMGEATKPALTLPAPIQMKAKKAKRSRGWET